MNIERNGFYLKSRPALSNEEAGVVLEFGEVSEVGYKFIFSGRDLNDVLMQIVSTHVGQSKKLEAKNNMLEIIKISIEANTNII